MRLFDKTMATLQGALDVRLERQNLLAGNIANADTPGFKPRDLDFASALVDAQHRHDPTAAALKGDLPLVVAPLPPPGDNGEGSAGAPGVDGNRVDLDRAMVSLSENALQYQSNARSLSKKLGILRMVAMDGGA